MIKSIYLKNTYALNCREQSETITNKNSFYKAEVHGGLKL